MRRRMRWLLWAYAWLCSLGCNSTGWAGRWFSDYLAKTEHGIRCLLIIGCQRLPRLPQRSAPVPERASHTSRSQADLPDTDHATWLDAHLRNHANLDLTGLDPAHLDQTRHSFCLTLSAFARPEHAADDTSSGPEKAPVTSDAKAAPKVEPKAEQNEKMRARLDAFGARLHALVDVFEDPDRFIARMAVRIRQRGFRLRRRAAMRPCGACAPVWIDALLPEPLRLITIRDTS